MRSRGFVLWLSVLFTTGPLFAGARAAEGVWDPGKTFVFVASVIEWPGTAGLAAFKDPRRDEAFVAQLKAAGVPASNVLFLKDKEATLAAMRRDLRALAGRAGEGSTFIFYFQGHGIKTKTKTWFACYDIDLKNTAETAFDVDELYTVFDKGWKGERLMLIGDCCHSGALDGIVRRFEKKPGVCAACLASATASNSSTGHWTFTESIISALAGDGAADRNRDGKITFGELDSFVHDEMKYRENQLTRATQTANFGDGFVLRAVAANRPAPAQAEGGRQVGEYLEAMDQEGKWYVSQILAIRGEKFRVHYCGWDSKWDEWVGPEKLRPIVRPKLKLGGLYEVQWLDKQWYLAKVTKSEEDYFYFVHYEGEEGDDDEWITPEKAHPAPAGKKPNPPEFAALAPRAAAKGDTVAARWRRDWFLAKVESIEVGIHHVRYADGDTGSLEPADLLPVPAAGEVKAGDRVLASWDGKPQMFPGRVLKLLERSCTVAWEDGTPATEVPFNQLARIRPAAGK